MRSKLNLVLLLTMVLIIRQSVSVTPFCSVICSKTSCNNDITPNGCTTCNTNWIPGNGTCSPDSSKQYYLLDKTTDLGGTLVVGPTATNTAVCSGNGGGGAFAYNLYGWQSTGTVTVTHATGIPKTFYQMIVYFGILSADSRGGKNSGSYWNSNTVFNLVFNGGDGFSQTNTYRLGGTTRISSQDVCYSTNRWEQWNKITQSYTYGTPNVSLTFNINNNEPNTSALWGMK